MKMGDVLSAIIVVSMVTCFIAALLWIVIAAIKMR
jgi:hypothetical protein